MCFIWKRLDSILTTKIKFRKAIKFKVHYLSVSYIKVRWFKCAGLMPPSQFL